MKKALFISFLLTSFVFIQATAQQSNIFPKGDIATNTENYTGKIWLNILSPGDSTFHFNVDVATYQKGSRLDWHIHPAGQILLISEGTGYYQEKGKPGQIIHQGDIVKCPPGIEHWHAAAPNSSFAYIAITPTDKGKTIWLQDVTDEEYNNVKASSYSDKEQQIIRLSKKKWQWMAHKNVEALKDLFDPKAAFVHMGGSWGKDQELQVIENGSIWYKKADIHSTNVQIIGNTAILLSKITLLAEVGGKEVTNPFMVTEVYTNKKGNWQLGSLSFTKLLHL